MGQYVERHPEYDVGTSGGRTFLTTGEPRSQSALIEAFWGAPLTFGAVNKGQAA